LEGGFVFDVQWDVMVGAALEDDLLWSGVGVGNAPLAGEGDRAVALGQEVDGGGVGGASVGDAVTLRGRRIGRDRNRGNRGTLAKTSLPTDTGGG
jgi:hypothetical protein